MTFNYPPFAVWSDHDHSGAVIIVTTLCLIYWLACGIISLGILLTHNTRLTWADGIFTSSMVSELHLSLNVHKLTKHQVIGIVQSTLVLCACHFGFGKSATLSRSDKISQAKKVRSPEQICMLNHVRAIP